MIWLGSGIEVKCARLRNGFQYTSYLYLKKKLVNEFQALINKSSYGNKNHILVLSLLLTVAGLFTCNFPLLVDLDKRR